MSLGWESTPISRDRCAQTEGGRELKIGTQMQTGILYLLLNFQKNPYTPSLCVPLGNSFPRALTPGWIQRAVDPKDNGSAGNPR